jgi:hypothetical protein
MVDVELVLDPGIRAWVVVPIVLLTFLVLLGKHYLALYMESRPKPDLAKLTDTCGATSIFFEDFFKMPTH